MGKSPMSTAALAIAAALFVPTACDRRGDADGAANSASAGTDKIATGAPAAPDAGEAPPLAGAPAAVTKTDALAMLMTIDEREIALADQAIRKNVTGKLHEYAEMMRTDHGQHLEDTIRLGGAVSTAPAVTALRNQGERELRTLEMRSGTAYEAAYVDAMVRGHVEALALIDATLLPAATTEAVRQHFTTTRATVARHLERAREIQATLK
ncbi:MAG TPA: DUF4142 domain-containing protein [Lysobacter sp.]|nr:DUF4142 domain-containing protein [Lysobacter sp.]